MKVQVVCMIVACTVMVDGQTGSSPAHKADEKQPAAGLYQRQAAARPHEQKDDFFTASTKLVNKNDFDYGAMLERRRQAFLDAERREPVLLVQCSDHGSADGADVGLRCARHGRETETLARRRDP